MSDSDTTHMFEMLLQRLLAIAMIHNEVRVSKVKSRVDEDPLICYGEVVVVFMCLEVLPVALSLLLWRSVPILLLHLLSLGCVLNLLDTAHLPHGTNTDPLSLTPSPLNPWPFLGPYLMALSD